MSNRLRGPVIGRGLAALLAAWTFQPGAAAVQTGATEPAAERVRSLVFDPAPEHLAIVDLDGDGKPELVAVNGPQLLLHRPGDEPLEGLIPGHSTVWTVADYGDDGSDDFMALVDGESLHRLRLEDGAFRWTEALLDGLGARRRIPRGTRPADILRDLNGDGRNDLVVPLGNRVRLLFGSPDGFRPGPDLDVAARLDLQTAGRTGTGMLGRVSRRLSVPRLRMRDLNGDGEPDLQVNDGVIIRQYVSSGGRLPDQPSSTVNLKEFQDKLPEIRFDPGNIVGLTRYVAWEEWGDLNLDGAQDLILLVGGYVLIYLGGEDGIDLRRRRDQLEAHGNVVYALATPIDEDPIPDLVLLRVEDVSLARALTWYLFSASLDVEVLAYKGLGNGRFAKRPLPQSKKLTLELPSIRTALKQKDDADALRRTVVRFADLAGGGDQRDLVVLDDRGNLSGYQGIVGRDLEVRSVMESLLGELLRRDRVIEVDMNWLYGWLLGRATVLLSLAQGQQPLFYQPQMPGWAPPQAMTAKDFDGDGRDEILVLRWMLGEENRPRLVGFILDPDQP